MRLIAISWPSFFKEEASIINALFEQGLSVLHIRKPEASEADVEELVAHIRPAFHDRLTMHYFADLAERLELGGYHLSHGHAPAPDEWEGRLSASCHSLTEVQTMLSKTDYVFLSPVFDSISKHEYKSGFSTDELIKAHDRGIIDRRVVALGGVTPESMPYVSEMGFGGAAVLGGLWGDLDYETVMGNYWAFLNCEMTCKANAV